MPYPGLRRDEAENAAPPIIGAHLIENQCNLKGNKSCKSLFGKKLKNFQKNPFLLLLTCAFDSNLVNQGRKEKRNFGFLKREVKRGHEYPGHREQNKKNLSLRN